MTDKDKSSTLSYKEIIKAFECCYLYDVMFCDKCPNKYTCGEIDVAESTLDLINRQQAEIKRLNGCVKTEEEVRTIAKSVIDSSIAFIKSEARKEFAERLLQRKYQSSDWSHGEHPFVVEVDDILDTLEEMG